MVARKQIKSNTVANMPASNTPKGKRDTEKLEIVVKGDVSGTVEAVIHSLSSISVPGVDIAVIRSGVGRISKTDIMMAATGSRLIIGFNVGTMPKLEQYIAEHCIEVRLYNVIYELIHDIKTIASKLISKAPAEKIIGKAKIIATFTGPRKGMVIGCEVLEGTLELGSSFRIITAMGPAYFGKISSLQIDRVVVKTAKAGQQAGIEIPNWKKAKIGDLFECYTPGSAALPPSWEPTCRIIMK